MLSVDTEIIQGGSGNEKATLNAGIADHLIASIGVWMKDSAALAYEYLG